MVWSLKGFNIKGLNINKQCFLRHDDNWLPTLWTWSQVIPQSKPTGMANGHLRKHDITD